LTTSRLRVAVVVVLIVAVAVGYLLVFRSPTVGQILAAPERYDGKTVTIQGKPDSPDRQGFGLDDGTGKIFIVSDKTVPLEGTEISVRGTVRKDYQLAGRRETVVVEQ